MDRRDDAPLLFGASVPNNFASLAGGRTNRRRELSGATGKPRSRALKRFIKPISSWRAAAQSCLSRPWARPRARILRTPAWQYPHRKQSSHQCAARLGLARIRVAAAFEKKKCDP